MHYDYNTPERTEQSRRQQKINHLCHEIQQKLGANPSLKFDSEDIRHYKRAGKKLTSEDVYGLKHNEYIIYLTSRKLLEKAAPSNVSYDENIDLTFEFINKMINAYLEAKEEPHLIIIKQ